MSGAPTSTSRAPRTSGGHIRPIRSCTPRVLAARCCQSAVWSYATSLCDVDQASTMTITGSGTSTPAGKGTPPTHIARSMRIGMAGSVATTVR
ncbi:hypothetical protein [Pseudolysinimonas kribbensis]|uniref:hypothetical protein n=1 Tax=Pseudolysinimonas kribbensis TaxID=433641 RepID=UPI0024E0D4FA|nr:hypothetical protein [Pseudolysinimonas kribbensis]